MSDVIIPDNVGYVIARRAWRFATNGYLHGYNSHCIWTPVYKNIARCFRSDFHTKQPCVCAPMLNCKCGFYGFKKIVGQILRSQDKICYVIGDVALWWHVIEHTIGYRAQYAYPINVEIRSSIQNHEEYAERISELYRIPYRVVSDEKSSDSFELII